MEVDHEKQVVYTEPLVLSPRDAPSLLAAMQPSQENTAQRLTSPIVSTQLNTRNIAFERLQTSFSVSQHFHASWKKKSQFELLVQE